MVELSACEWKIVSSGPRTSQCAARGPLIKVFSPQIFICALDCIPVSIRSLWISISDIYDEKLKEIESVFAS